MSRECGDCTLCCEGWLTGSALGKSFFPGKPCHFVSVGKGCTTYATRPQNPCIEFKCEWLTNKDIPEWMKPNQVKAIIHTKESKGIKYLSITEAGQTLRSDVLTQIIMYAIANQINLVWSVNSGAYWIGSQEFCDLMESENNKKE